MKVIRYIDQGAKVWYRNGDHHYALRKQLRPNSGENIYRCGANEHIVIKPRMTTQENWRDKRVAHNVYIVRRGKERRPERLFHKKLEQKMDKFTIQKAEKKKEMVTDVSA